MIFALFYPFLGIKNFPAPLKNCINGTGKLWWRQQDLKHQFPTINSFILKDFSVFNEINPTYAPAPSFYFFTPPSPSIRQICRSSGEHLTWIRTLCVQTPRTVSLSVAVATGISNNCLFLTPKYLTFFGTSLLGVVLPFFKTEPPTDA